MAASAPSKGGVTSASSSSALQTLVNAHQIATPTALLNFFVSTLLDDQLAADRRAPVADFLTGAAAAGGAPLALHGGQSLPLTAGRRALHLPMSQSEYQPH